MTNLRRIAAICSALIMHCAGVYSQKTLLYKTIDKIQRSQNFTYTSTDVFKNPSAEDTTVYRNDAEFLKVRGDSVYGYHFKIKQRQLAGLFKGSVSVDTYNGQDILTINFQDSTYQINKADPKYFNYRTSLLGNLKWIKDLLDHNPAKIKQAADSIINSNICHHFIFNLYDKVVNNKRMYHNLHLFIDNSSELPICFIYEGISKLSEDTYFIDFNKSIYSDYHFDQDHIVISQEPIPNGFHPPKKRLALLAPGTIAPAWNLFSTDGRKLSLVDLKGKVILLDFSFIGCGNCMSALQPMNLLHEKYKQKNVVIASIFFRDKAEVVKKFAKTNGLAYPVYVDANSEVTKSYHVPGGPYFYFIDQTGKVQKVIEGYNAETFEKESTSIIDNLLAK